MTGHNNSPSSHSRSAVDAAYEVVVDFELESYRLANAKKVAERKQRRNTTIAKIVGAVAVPLLIYGTNELVGQTNVQGIMLIVASGMTGAALRQLDQQVEPADLSLSHAEAGIN
jgi:hypothetical protein